MCVVCGGCGVYVSERRGREGGRRDGPERRGVRKMGRSAGANGRVSVGLGGRAAARRTGEALRARGARTTRGRERRKQRAWWEWRAKAWRSRRKVYGELKERGRPKEEWTEKGGRRAKEEGNGRREVRPRHALLGYVPVPHCIIVCHETRDRPQRRHRIRRGQAASVEQPREFKQTLAGPACKERGSPMLDRTCR